MPISQDKVAWGGDKDYIAYFKQEPPAVEEVQIPGLITTVEDKLPWELTKKEFREQKIGKPENIHYQNAALPNLGTMPNSLAAFFKFV